MNNQIYLKDTVDIFKFIKIFKWEFAKLIIYSLFWRTSDFV